MQIISILILSMFIEGIVTAIKPLWSKDDPPMSISEMVSIALGIVLAVCCRLNMLDTFEQQIMPANAPAWLAYGFYVMTGIALGRGPSFLWDLWQRLRDTAQKPDDP